MYAEKADGKKKKNEGKNETERNKRMKNIKINL